MTTTELQTSFYKETGAEVVNSQGEFDIDYVQWLEKKALFQHAEPIIESSNIAGGYTIANLRLCWDFWQDGHNGIKGNPETFEQWLMQTKLHPNFRPIYSFTEDEAKQTENKISKKVAKRLLAIRDALVQNYYNEAYHQLYKIASPNVDKMSDEVWAELEAIANHREEGCTCEDGNMLANATCELHGFKNYDLSKCCTERVIPKNVHAYREKDICLKCGRNCEVTAGILDAEIKKLSINEGK